MPSPRRAAPALAAALLLAGAAPARADDVTLHTGKVVEGKVSKSGNKITVKGWKGKSTTYAASEVEDVNPGECSWEAADRMRREIPADASDDLQAQKRLEIGLYLKERAKITPEMEDLARKEFEQVLKKVPDHEQARLALGHVKWEEWWFEGAKEMEKFRKGAPAAQMEPKGYVKYRKTGLWEKQEDVDAMEAGKVRYRGQWMTEDEKRIAQGYVKDESGNWVLKRDQDDRLRAADVEKALGEKPVTVTSSRNFSFVSWLNATDTAMLKDLCERTYAAHRELLGFPIPKGEGEADDLFPDPIVAYVLVDLARKTRWVESYGKAFGWNDAALNFRGDEKARGWHDLGPFPYMLVSGEKTEKNRERDEEQDILLAKSRLTSMVGRLLLDRIRSGGTPSWFSEANAFLSEIRMNGTADCCYVSMAKYREEVADKRGAEGRAKYYAFMKKQIAVGLDRPLLQLFSLDLNDLDWADTVKCWSFLEFLSANHNAGFRALYRNPMLQVEEITPEHVKAAVAAKVPKDPTAEVAKKPKDEGPMPTGNQKVSGPGAIPVTEGSKEERAIRAAVAEAWIAECVKKDLASLEKDWKAWVMAKPAQ
jgi:hypothetical protein